MSEFSIDPKTINEYVANKIIESSMGEALKSAIDEQVKKLSSSYDNPMKGVVAMALSAAAREYLETPEMKTRLRAAVETALTEEAFSRIISQIEASGWNR